MGKRSVSHGSQIDRAPCRVVRNLASCGKTRLSRELLRDAVPCFPGGSRGPCVPRMALNLEVLFVPQGAEPIAKGNCVAVMRGGEEAGGKTGSRRTEIGYKPAHAKAGGQCGAATRHGAGTPGTPSDHREGRSVGLQPTGLTRGAASGKYSVLPWDTSPALRALPRRGNGTAP